MAQSSRHPARPSLVALALLGLLLSAAPRAHAAGEWNDTGISWRPYEAGMAEAKASRKPVCLIVYAEWCPHCTNYSQVFHDPRVVEMAKRFVMVRIDKEAEPKVAALYKPDGDYVPRTVFLASDGKLRPEIDAQRTDYRYFYSERDPASVLRGMEVAAGVTKAAPEPAAKQGPASSKKVSGRKS